MPTDRKKELDQSKAEPRKDDVKDLSAKKLNRDEEESVKGGRMNMRKDTE